ncbi:DUF6907 domain-containing protein [Streptomyces acidiscabies]|uniref:DUF6907 domain-containing protein n=1 Tax=Streptomyces acidiscabies TaxID=42234 RepID=UPI00095277E9|nr:hypothetical protein [Streptomyces acidiscabies]
MNKVQLTAPTTTPDTTALTTRAALLAALPASVDKAMRLTLPNQYTPELAQQIADGMIARLTGHFPYCKNGACLTHEGGGIEHVGTEYHFDFPTIGRDPLHLTVQAGYAPELDDAPNVQLGDPGGNLSILDAAGVLQAAARFGELAATLRRVHRQITADTTPQPSGPNSGGSPLSADERGTEWMARYGCPPFCQLDHAGADGEPGWHSTAPIETRMRDIDAEGPADVPFLSAQVVVHNDRPQAYGRHTKLWLHYGLTTGELTPARAREVLTEMRGFCAELEAVVDDAEVIGADDFEGDPEVARLDQEAEDRRIRAISARRS